MLARVVVRNKSKYSKRTYIKLQNTVVKYAFTPIYWDAALKYDNLKREVLAFEKLVGFGTQVVVNGVKIPKRTHYILEGLRNAKSNSDIDKSFYGTSEFEDSRFLDLLKEAKKFDDGEYRVVLDALEEGTYSKEIADFAREISNDLNVFIHLR